MPLHPSVEEKIKSFGDNVRSLRIAKGWSMKKLAEIAEIELSQVHRIEIAKINPKLSTVFILADALNVNVEELFTARKP